MVECDNGLPKWEQRWRDRLKLFGENKELLMAWNDGTMEIAWDEPTTIVEPK